MRHGSRLAFVHSVIHNMRVGVSLCRLQTSDWLVLVLVSIPRFIEEDKDDDTLQQFLML